MIGLLLSLALVLPPTTSPCDKGKLKQMVHDSLAVLVAEVKEVEAPSLMQSWSGLAVFKQHVRYEVKAVLKGKVPQSEVWVGYPIYYNSLTADKSGPQLSPELFKKNNIHIIFLKLDKKPAPSSVTPPGSPSYVTLDVNCGAIIATPAVEAKIRRLALKP